MLILLLGEVNAIPQKKGWNKNLIKIFDFSNSKVVFILFTEIIAI